MFSEIMQFLYDKGEPFELVLENSENANLLGRPFFKPARVMHKIPDVHQWMVPFHFKGKGRLHRLYYKNRMRGWKGPGVHQKLILKKLESGKYPVFHPTYYDDYYLNIPAEKRKFKTVLTVYDLIHDLYPGYFSPDDFVIRNRRKLLDSADIIVAISESTRNDLIRIYKVRSEKIKVIHLGSSLPVTKNTGIKSPVSGILYVGDRRNYKNFLTLLRAIAPVLNKNEVILIAAGSHPFNHEEMQVMKSLNIEGKVVHRKFSGDAELAELYRNADLFVFPSLYEGFGIPLLEAMSQGCPVVCSNTSSFPEVVGDAAVMFDPTDTESMTAAISSVLASDSLKKELAEKGYRRLENFSWKKTGEEYLKVYKGILD